MIIAERILEITVSGQTKALPIRFMKPKCEADGIWVCRYEVGWPEHPETRQGHGGDSVQALLSAMQMVGVELYTSTYHKDGLLRFDGWEGGYGFPVANAVRDLLTGHDARYL